MAVAIVGGSSLPAAVAAGTQPPASRSVASPSSGHAPVQLATEDFENGVTTTPIVVNRYTGANGETYRADKDWLDVSACNGIVTSRSSSPISECASDADEQLRQMAGILGDIGGTDKATNHVVSAFTNRGPIKPDQIQLASVKPIAIGAKGRYVSFGVDAAAKNCQDSSPLLNFSLVDGTNEYPLSDKPIDPCTDPGSTSTGGVKAGKFVSHGGVLVAGDSLQWVLRNGQGSGSGNDGAIDNVTLYDSTPSLSNTFSGTPLAGESGRLTFTVENTSENGAKPGWSFTEALPAGLRLAASPNLATTCAKPAIVAAADATTITAEGDLDSQVGSCSISVDVTSKTAATYSIDSSNLTAHAGLDLPSATTITFGAVKNELGMTERVNLTGGNGDAVADLGEKVAFHYTVTNQGDSAVNGLVVAASAGAVTCEVTTLEPGKSTDCSTAPRDVVQKDIDAGSIDDAATATATTSGGVNVSAKTQATAPSTTIQSSASLAIHAVETGDHKPRAGDQVGLAATVVNSGTSTLRQNAVTIVGQEGMTVECPAVELAPGAKVDCEVHGTYAVTQADVDRGEIEFHAGLTALDAKGNSVSTTAATTQETVAPAASLGTSLTADRVENGRTLPAAGDEIGLTIAVTNTGNVTISDVSATVPELASSSVDCASTTLAPGETVTCTIAPATIGQSDIEKGRIQFSLDANGRSPKGDDVRSSSDDSVDLTAGSGLDLVATWTPENGGTTLASGDTIRATFTVTDTGNLTVGTLAVVSEQTGAVRCDAVELKPGSSVHCSATSVYTVTSDDAEAGFITFTAVAQGLVSRPDGFAAPVASDSGLASAPADQVRVASSTVTKRFEISADVVPPAPVEPAPAVLAFTGSDVLPLGAAVTALFVLSGLALFLASRRRHEKATD